MGFILVTGSGGEWQLSQGWCLFANAKGGGGGGASLNFDFTTGVLPGAITFTRPSIGTYNSSGGILTTASANAARFNYVGGVACLLIEPAATNLLVQSNNFLTTWGNFNNTVVTAAQFISPDGTNNGWSITAGTGSGNVQQPITFNTTYTMSVWTKLISGATDLSLWLNGLSSLVSPTAALARLFAVATPTAGTGAAALLMNGVSGTNGIYGAQLETGSVMTSYIPTTTAAVTRAADSATFTIPAGVGHLTYTFDDNSTQLVTVSAGSYTIPTNLTRPNIKTIVGSA